MNVLYPSDNQSQYTYATTKPADIFSLPPTSPTSNNNNNNNHLHKNNKNNEPTLTTTTTTTSTSKNNNDNNDQNDDLIRPTKLSTNDATTAKVPVNEPPCERKTYYKCGPSDKDITTTSATTTEAAVPTATTDEPIIATAVTSSETVGKA